MVPPRGRIPLTSLRLSSKDFSGQMRPSKPSGMPMTFHPYLMMAIIKYGWKVIGIPDGFDGLICPEKSFELSLKEVSGILPRGGTILGTTNRGDPFHYKTLE